MVENKQQEWVNLGHREWSEVCGLPQKALDTGSGVLESPLSLIQGPEKWHHSGTFH